MLHTTYNFLESLKKNNNRDWVQANKSQYDKSKSEVNRLANAIFESISNHDELEGKIKIFRLNRDIRFSKDKTPYKTHWSGGFQRAGRDRRGGYYYQITPGATYVACGFFGPNPNDLLHIRKQIAQDPDALRQILATRSFQETFGELQGEKVKTAPKGFSVEDPAINLIRYKQFYVEHQFSDDQVLSDDFPERVSVVYKNARPFLDYMTDILRTDLNGTPLP